MKEKIKTLVKLGLSKVGFKLIRSRLESVSYRRLFDDLVLILNKPNPFILDVGANNGQTIDALQEVFETPNIHAFEPSTKVFARLSEKDFGPQVTLHNYALGEHQEQREFINYEWSTMSSFLELSQAEQNKYRDLNVVDVEQVIIQTVDQFLSDHQIKHVDLLKIDTQGFDYNVLLGAKDALAKRQIKHVLIELNFIEMYEKQASWQEIATLLEANGLYLIDYYEKVRNGHTIAWCTALFGRRAVI